MKMGNQGRPGFTPPKAQPEPQVEVEKFDPATLAPPPRQRPPRTTEEDLMANADPINTKAVFKSAAPPPKPAEAPMAPPEPAKEPLEILVPDSLIAKLEAKFGIKPETFHEATLDALGQKLNITFRLPSYDDYIWSMAVIENKIVKQEDASLLATDSQRNNMLQHLADCRAIVKIEGEWLWQIYKREAEIKTVVPNWDGKWDAIPDFIRGTMASAVYDLFRKRLHADLLFALEAAVKSVEKPKDLKDKLEKPTEDDRDEATEDPSSAA